MLTMTPLRGLGDSGEVDCSATPDDPVCQAYYDGSGGPSFDFTVEETGAQGSCAAGYVWNPALQSCVPSAAPGAQAQRGGAGAPEQQLQPANIAPARAAADLSTARAVLTSPWFWMMFGVAVVSSAVVYVDYRRRRHLLGAA